MKTKKTPIRIQHPWVTYRKLLNIKLSNNANGCLIFVPHTIPGIEIVDYKRNIENFVNLAIQRFKKNRIVFCLSKNDIINGNYKILRKFKIPIFTLGNPESQFFVDRFYMLARNFKYSTSPNSGSQMYYCTELGMEYYLLGEKLTYRNFNHHQLPFGILCDDRSKARLDAVSYESELFSEKNRNFNARKRNLWVKDILGLGINSNKLKKEIKNIFLTELIVVSFLMPLEFYKRIIRYYKNNGFKRLMIKLLDVASF